MPAGGRGTGAGPALPRPTPTPARSPGAALAAASRGATGSAANRLHAPAALGGGREGHGSDVVAAGREGGDVGGASRDGRGTGRGLGGGGWGWKVGGRAACWAQAVPRLRPFRGVGPSGTPETYGQPGPHQGRCGLSLTGVFFGMLAA